MRVLISFSILSVFLCLQTSLAASGTVILLKGKAEFKGSPLLNGDVLTGKGEIKTHEKSLVRFEVKGWGNEITIGPNSSMVLDFDAKVSSEGKKIFYTLLGGICRWRSDPSSKSKEDGPLKSINTKQASLGIRGTDFILKSNTLLGETEVIVFDGKVVFQNLKNKSDEKNLTKGQWGGIGGRFGDSIGSILDLPQNVIEQFNKSL